MARSCSTPLSSGRLKRLPRSGRPGGCTRGFVRIQMGAAGAPTRGQRRGERGSAQEADAKSAWQRLRSPSNATRKRSTQMRRLPIEQLGDSPHAHSVPHTQNNPPPFFPAQKWKLLIHCPVHPVTKAVFAHQCGPADARHHFHCGLWDWCTLMSSRWF